MVTCFAWTSSWDSQLFMGFSHMCMFTPVDMADDVPVAAPAQGHHQHVEVYQLLVSWWYIPVCSKEVRRRVTRGCSSSYRSISSAMVLKSHRVKSMQSIFPSAARRKPQSLSCIGKSLWHTSRAGSQLYLWSLATQKTSHIQWVQTLQLPVCFSGGQVI